jgi:putative transport protein
MSFLVDLFYKPSIAGTLLILFLSSAIGVLIGKIEFKNIRIGIAGVLFSGLFISHFGVSVEAELLHFIRELGLLLFVFSIGLEIGPRFFSSLKKVGLKLNLLAASIVILGVICAIVVKMVFNVELPVAVGLLCGAVTNTPGLGAAQQLLGSLKNLAPNALSSMGMSYAIAYPFGVLGIILAMTALRIIFRINIDKESASYEESVKHESAAIESVSVKVQNSNIIGKSVNQIKELSAEELIVTRVKRNGEFIVAEDTLIIKEGDFLYGVCEIQNINKIELRIGEISINTIEPAEGHLAMKEVIVTNRRVAGKTLEEIGIYRRYPANISRVYRGDVEIMPTLNMTIEFGDTVRIVGKKIILDDVAKELGNSLKDLAHPNVLTIFLGIVAGIILGSIPIYIPGLNIPAKLGLAGGPLIVAIILGSIGRIGKFDFYVVRGANLILRELGIILFMAAIGLNSGKGFVDAIYNGAYIWMAYGAIITFVPIFIVGMIARYMKINYLTICGLLAGAMTDPPALEFANRITPSQAQSLTYATVYPFVMMMRIISAQLIILFLL